MALDPDGLDVDLDPDGLAMGLADALPLGRRSISLPLES